MVLFSYFNDSKIVHILLLEIGSIPDDGSSKNIILEFPIKDIPNDSFLFIPPERCYEYKFLSYNN